jgi:hypothetical protein
VLGVGLREHHQLDVGGVAAQRAEALDQIVDLVVGQGQPSSPLAAHQRRAPAASRSTRAGTRLGLLEQPLGVGEVEQRHLGHAVVQQRRRRPAAAASSSRRPRR